MWGLRWIGLAIVLLMATSIVGCGDDDDDAKRSEPDRAGAATLFTLTSRAGTLTGSAKSCGSPCPSPRRP